MRIELHSGFVLARFYETSFRKAHRKTSESQRAEAQ